ncbi:MAG TPA: FtsX-like permease family protein [Cyclobacteriaceae bacterium]|jgi:ABC-type antimicrobial peptide transport system permease subunit|nr:FtsX-like permease family protein [Cyclobacteriaceae bacterium]
MLKNYIIVAIRSLRKNKSFVIINAFGLGIALACCIAAYLILAFNVEFDDFHADKKVERIFKIHAHFKEKDGKITQSNNAPMVLPPIGVPGIAGIERYTRYLSDAGYMRYGDKAFSEQISFADSTFFEMFDFPLLSGNQKAFKNKHSIFLSEELAKKYFADEEAVGKILVLNFQNEFQVEAIVGGVLKKVPVNNSFTFKAMMRIENLQDVHKIAVDSWGEWRDPSTFLELTSASNAASVGKQFDKYIFIRNEAKKDAHVVAYQLEPFKAYFTWNDINWGYANMRMGAAPLVVFTSMAVMILLIACFNLTNTSIAMTAKRLKEVGIRKAVGAMRQQIVSQFLFETALTITLSLGVGLLLAQWIVPAFTEMWNLPFVLTELNGMNLVVTLLGIVFFASLLAGIYPALFNSKFKPVALLKGSVKIGGTNALTRTLVAFQFALSVIVLVGGVVFIQNTKFQEAINYGYDKEMVVTVNIQSEKEFEAMKSAVASNPKILEVSVSDHHVGQNNYEFPVQIDTSEYRAQLMGIGKNYFETMGLKLNEGRFLDLENISDQNEAIIVNRAFINKVGLKDPLDKIVTVHDKKRHIVGVIENHVDNLYRSKDPEPFLFYPAQSKEYKMMQVRAEASDLASVKQYLEDTWKKLYPARPFESRFQDEIVLGNIQRVNGNLKKIFLFLTVLGGLLSASGIFSLASLNIAKRTKEIGIRKALGATVSNVVMLLNREFVIILTLAGVVGSVGGFYLTKALLDVIYKYHISIQIGSVIICAAVIFAIGIFTTSVTILKAAKANPVDTLRSE